LAIKIRINQLQLQLLPQVGTQSLQEVSLGIIAAAAATQSQLEAILLPNQLIVTKPNPNHNLVFLEIIQVLPSQKRRKLTLPNPLVVCLVIMLNPIQVHLHQNQRKRRPISPSQLTKSLKKLKPKLQHQHKISVAQVFSKLRLEVALPRKRTNPNSKLLNQLQDFQVLLIASAKIIMLLLHPIMLVDRKSLKSNKAVVTLRRLKTPKRVQSLVTRLPVIAPQQVQASLAKSQEEVQVLQQLQILQPELATTRKKIKG